MRERWVSRRHKYGDTSSLIADLASSDSGIVQYALPVHGLHGMLVSPARRRIGLDIEVLRLPPLSTLFALEDNQSSASARTHRIHTGLPWWSFSRCVTDAQTALDRHRRLFIHTRRNHNMNENTVRRLALDCYIHARSNLHSPHTNVHFPVSRPVTDGFCLFSRHTEKQPRRAAAQCRSERALPPFCCFAPEDNSFHASACRSKSSSSENMSA